MAFLGFVPELVSFKGTGFEFGRFTASARAFVQKLEWATPNVEAEFAKKVEEAFVRIVERTPVDRNPERDDIVAKESWTFDADRRGRRLVFTIANEARNPRNDFPYPGSLGAISPMMLEYGHSRQAPQGMVRVSLEEMRNEMGRAVADALHRAMSGFVVKGSSAFGSIRRPGFSGR